MYNIINKKTIRGAGMDNNKQNSAIGDNTYEGKAIVTFPADSLILKEGEVNLDLYKIIQGRAEIYVGYGTENEVLLGIIGPGACIGELGLLMQLPAIYTVIAFSDVYAMRVTEERMGNFITENQSSVLQIMKNMAKTMAIMQHQIYALGEELNTYTKKNEDAYEEAKRDLLKSLYNPNGSGMHGKMYYLGGNKKN